MLQHMIYSDVYHTGLSDTVVNIEAEKASSSSRVKRQTYQGNVKQM